MSREKFATQVDSELLRQMRMLAQNDGRHLQTLVNEAFADYLDRRHQQRARPHVMSAYEASRDRYASVYRKLAR
jgi:predicted transcriptional regulator